MMTTFVLDLSSAQCILICYRQLVCYEISVGIKETFETTEQQVFVVVLLNHQETCKNMDTVYT